MAERFGPIEVRYDDKGRIDEVCAPGVHLERLTHESAYLAFYDAAGNLVQVDLFAQKNGRLKMTVMEAHRATEED